ncbi:MAG: prepilin peptidase, partial [Coriobacteriales bacterium]|nr:prepilin peptidase [Coriobacteriales bacterium]
MMQLALTIIIFVLVFLLGTVIASFLNVLVYRIPRRLDFVRGRSFCPNCEHPLAATDLVPVLSYLALRRRCRYCHEPISARYLLVELTGGLLALLSWFAFLGPDAGAALLLMEETGPPLLPADPWLLGAGAPVAAAALCFAVLSVLLTITLIDADTMTIPDGLNVALAVLGLLSIICGPEIDLISRGIGIVAISLPLLIISLILPGAFGGG